MKISPKLKRELPLYLMILLPFTLLIVYNYGPILGIVMAFQKFVPVKGFFGSEWVGLANFRKLFMMPDIPQVIWNTFYISFLKIVFDTLAAIVFAILLNEVRHRFFKKTVQTIIYFPYFLSWVILGGILRDILANDGLANIFLGIFGIGPISFLSNAAIFPWVLVVTEVWQITGYGTIVFLAAIAGINPGLYEAAAIDGAGRWKQTLHVTIPGMSVTIVVMVILSMGSILNAGFDQIINLYSPMVYSTGDVIDTWVYRMGLQQAQYSIGTAFGLFRSVVSLVMISLSYFIAYKKADYRVL